MPAVSDFGVCGHIDTIHTIRILRYSIYDVAVQGQARVVHSLALVRSVNDQFNHHKCYSNTLLKHVKRNFHHSHGFRGYSVAYLMFPMFSKIHENLFPQIFQN